MKRYVICPIIPATPGGPPSQGNRPAVADLPDVQGFSAVIPTLPSGAPKYLFALVVVSTDNLPAVLQLSNTYVLPDYALDGRMDGMEADARGALTQNVPAYDMDGAGLHFTAAHADAQSYRQVLQSLGEQFEPAFDLDNFDVREGQS